jgi:hypothetical protein
VEERDSDTEPTTPVGAPDGGSSPSRLPAPKDDDVSGPPVPLAPEDDKHSDPSGKPVVYVGESDEVGTQGSTTVPNTPASAPNDDDDDDDDDAGPLGDLISGDNDNDGHSEPVARGSHVSDSQGSNGASSQDNSRASTPSSASSKRKADELDTEASATRASKRQALES